MTVIALLTDFGVQDGYAGIMKGVIWKIAPATQIADLSHAVPPQDVLRGALALSRTAPYFSAGAIFVAVVDPGVGTARRPLAMRLGKNYFVGPDNGLFTLVIERAKAAKDDIRVIHLDRREYWLPEISHVFHGRDIFSPVAAHLANGLPLEAMGTEIDDPILLDIPHPQRIPSGGWRGQVWEVDYFGNLSTNLQRLHIQGLEPNLTVHIAGRHLDGLVNTFGDRPPGTLIALYGTSDDLVISVVNGNAAQSLGVGIGEYVEVEPSQPGTRMSS